MCSPMWGKEKLTVSSHGKEHYGRRESVVIFLFKLIARTKVFHSSILHDSFWLWPCCRPFPPEAQTTLCEPELLTGPRLACRSPPLISLYLSITKITAIKEATHSTKTFLTLHQDEITCWSHEMGCWQLSFLRAAHVCVHHSQRHSGSLTCWVYSQGFSSQFQ